MSTSGTETIVTPDGHKRILNLQPSDPAKVKRLVKSFGVSTIPLSEIREFSAWPADAKIKDQDGAGACNGHAVATSLEASRAYQGMPYVPLSAWWVYGCLVKGRDMGSNIMDGLELAQKSGVAPESDVKYGDFSGRYTQQAASNALRFKVEIGTSVAQSFDEVLTAVALRRVLNAAVRATNGWSGALDADGCPPVGRGPCNHAITIGGGIKKLRNGEFAVLMTNSWGIRWGLDGTCWLKRAHFENTSWFEAYEVLAAARDPQDYQPSA